MKKSFLEKGDEHLYLLPIFLSSLGHLKFPLKIYSKKDDILNDEKRGDKTKNSQ